MKILFYFPLQFFLGVVAIVFFFYFKPHIPQTILQTQGQLTEDRKLPWKLTSSFLKPLDLVKEKWQSRSITRVFFVKKS